MKKISLLFLLLFFVTAGWSQTKVTLEKLRCFSNMGPVMNYWNNAEVQKTFLSDLQAVLAKRQGIDLIERRDLPVDMLTNTSSINPVPSYTNADTNLLHLYVDLYEFNATAFFAYAGITPKMIEQDSMLFKRAKTYFVIRATVFNAIKKPTFSEELNVILSGGETLGIGVAYENFNGYSVLATTPKGFSSLMGKGMDLLFDTSNVSQVVEMKVQPVYMADNYTIPFTSRATKILVQNKNNASRFIYQNKTEIVRMGDPLYEDIITRNRKLQLAKPDLLNTLKNFSANFDESDFVYLRQDCRDVVRDKNYLIKLVVQLNPYFFGNGPKAVFTNFIETNIHRLLRDKDTLANFAIEKNLVNEEDKLIYLDKISNGIDTGSYFAIKNKPLTWPMRYNYVIKGKIAKNDFSIFIGGPNNRLKEFYLNGKMICIAEGGFNPDKFAISDPDMDVELLNQLFMIGFCRFFE